MSFYELFENVHNRTFFNYFDNNINPSYEVINAKKLEGLYTLLQIKPELASHLFDFDISKKINLYEFMEIFNILNNI